MSIKTFIFSKTTLLLRAYLISEVVDTEIDILYSAIDTILKRKQLSDVQRLRSISRYTSRVHISDICQALYASIQKSSSG